MGYKRAEEVLPIEIIEIIQQYIDGENIYIPRKEAKRAAWGSHTSTRRELACRNQNIYKDYCAGMKIAQIAAKYFLSEKSIQRIVREMRQ